MRFHAAMPASASASPMVPVGSRTTTRGPERLSGYDLFQQTVISDMQNKFGGPEALTSAVASRFGPRPTTVGFNRLYMCGLLCTESAGARKPFATHETEYTGYPSEQYARRQSFGQWWLYLSTCVLDVVFHLFLSVGRASYRAARTANRHQYAPCTGTPTP